MEWMPAPEGGEIVLFDAGMAMVVPQGETVIASLWWHEKYMVVTGCESVEDAMGFVERMVRMFDAS
jgi:hypothetical protein